MKALIRVTASLDCPSFNHLNNIFRRTQFLSLFILRWHQTIRQNSRLCEMFQIYMFCGQVMATQQITHTRGPLLVCCKWIIYLIIPTESPYLRVVSSTYINKSHSSRHVFANLAAASECKQEEECDAKGTRVRLLPVLQIKSEVLLTSWK